MVVVKFFGKTSAGYDHIITADIAGFPVEVNGRRIQGGIIAIGFKYDDIPVAAVAAKP